MDDPLGDAGRGQQLAEVAALDGAGKVLDEDDVVVVGIGELDDQVAIYVFLRTGGDGNVLRGEINAQLLNIGGLKGDVIEAVLGGTFEIRGDQYILVVVDLEATRGQFRET